MRKFIFILTLIFAFGFANDASAEINYYKTTHFAYAKKINNVWQWSDWEASDLLVKFDLSNDVITIYSPETQVYNVLKFLRSFTDENGGKQVEFRVVDQDGDYGSVRLRIEKSGSSQIYVEYQNVCLAYTVKRV